MKEVTIYFKITAMMLLACASILYIAKTYSPTVLETNILYDGICIGLSISSGIILLVSCLDFKDPKDTENTEKKHYEI